jgi:hypothetical protein
MLHHRASDTIGITSNVCTLYPYYLVLGFKDTIKMGLLTRRR